MSRPTCETCPHWVRGKRTFDGDKEEPSRVGMCYQMPHFVLRAEHDWCGQHPDFPAWLEAQREPAAPDYPLCEERGSTIHDLGFHRTGYTSAQVAALVALAGDALRLIKTDGAVSDRAPGVNKSRLFMLKRGLESALAPFKGEEGAGS